MYQKGLLPDRIQCRMENHKKKASQIGSEHPRYGPYGSHGVQRGARGDGPELSHYCCSTPILGCLHAAAARSCYGSVRKYGVRGIRIAGCRMRMYYMIQTE